MRTTINLEDNLLRMAKQRALEEGSTLGAVVNEALRVGLLAGQTEESVVEERPLKTYGGGGVQPGVDLNNSADLQERMERP